MPGLNWTRLEDRIQHLEGFNPIWNDGNFQINPTRHFDCSTKSFFFQKTIIVNKETNEKKKKRPIRNLTITLGKMNVTKRKFCSWNIDRKINTRASGEVLDVTIATVFSWWHCSGSSCGDVPP